MINKKLILFCMIPFFWACSSHEIQPIPQDDANALTEYLQASHQSPAEFIRTFSESKEPVILYGNKGLQSEIQFLSYLVPVLADMDHLSIGLWFLNSVDQKILDEYFSGESDEYTSSEILFLSDPSQTGYLEYADFLSYLRNFILKSPVTMNWDITGVKGIPSERRPFLVYIDRTSSEEYSSQYHNSPRILLHNPLSMPKGDTILPFRGELYDLMIHQWPLYRYSGIPLKDTSFGELSLLSEEDINPVREEFDGLILLGIENFTPLTPIEGFITEENAEYALKSFPDQIIRNKYKPASYLMNLKLRRSERRNQKQLSEMTKILLKNYPSE